MKFRLTMLAALLTIGTEGLANDLWFPQIAAGGGYTTKITLANVDLRGTAPALGQLFFYNQDGSARTVTTLEAGTASSFNITVPYQGTRTLTITSRADVAVGAAKYQGDAVVTGGVATYTFGATAVGVLPGNSISNGYVPLLLRPGFDTGIAVVNTFSAPIDVQFSLLNPDGSSLQTGSRVRIPTNGQVARLVGPELGFRGPFAPGTALQISVIGSGTFAALPLSLGNGFISSSTTIDPNDAQTPLYIPHVALGSGYTMNFRIFNSSDAPLGGTLRFKDSAGKPLPVVATQTTTVDVTPTTPDLFEVASIPAKGSVVLGVSAPGPLKVGYATWESFIPNNPVIRVPAPTGIAATIFSDPVHVGESGTTNFYSAAIPVDVGQGINTGVALATAGINGSKISVSLRDSSGASVAASNLAALNPLAAGNQLARYASEFFDGITIAGGYMIVESSGPDGFLPLAILDSSGTFSTTAVIRRSLYAPSQLAGNFTGAWNNTTFGSTGAARLNLSINSTTNVATINIDVDGNVFGGPDPPAETWTCTVTLEGCKATFISPVFGAGIFVLRPDGTLYIRSTPSGGFFNMDGYLNSRNLWGAYSVGLGSLRAIGTFSLSK